MIDEAADLGVRAVQFIGGEPTLHPNLEEFIVHARDRRLAVEVFSNLVRVTASLWEIFARTGVSLATSYYSDAPAGHDRVTRRRGSHCRTRAAIAEAVRRAIPIRVGIIDVHDGQRVDEAARELQELGVTDIGIDRIRQVGRGQRDQTASIDQLCGRCAGDVLAVSPEGNLWPCVFARWLPVGNVRERPLAAILSGPELAPVRTMLADRFAERADPSGHGNRPCFPDCNPACQPNCPPSCSPACRPAQNCGPTGRCWPYYR